MTRPVSSIVLSGDGRAALSGEATVHTVAGLLRDGAALFNGTQPAITIDLSAVTAVDSAGVSLLLEWIRVAQLGDRHLTYAGLPARVRAIARVAGVEEILGV